MPDIIQVKRGMKANLPQRLATGEMAYTYDTEELFVGNGENLPLTQMATKEYVDQLREDILYKPIAINSFTNNKGTVEIGSTQTGITLSWTLSKDATAQTVDGTTVPNSQKTFAYSGSVSANKTFTLLVGDERGATATKTTAITFLNGIYWGVSSNTTLNSALITSLTGKVLSDTKGRTFTVNATSGQYVYYAIPDRLGACAFKVGGFDGGFDLAGTIDFTNPSGYTEKYKVYKSTNASLGNTSVTVN